MNGETRYFKHLVPYSFINELETGAIQIIDGAKGKYGQWEIVKNEYFYYFPYDDTGRVIKRILEESLAFYID